MPRLSREKMEEIVVLNERDIMILKAQVKNIQANQKITKFMEGIQQFHHNTLVDYQRMQFRQLERRVGKLEAGQATLSVENQSQST